MNKVFATMVVVLIFNSGFVYAQDNEKSKSKSTEQESKNSDFSEDQRKVMAERHEQMANCLRSGKRVKECRSELMGMNQQMMWGEECPMMDMMQGRAMMKNKESYKEKNSTKKVEKK